MTSVAHETSIPSEEPDKRPHRPTGEPLPFFDATKPHRSFSFMDLLASGAIHADTPSVDTGSVPVQAEAQPDTAAVHQGITEIEAVLAREAIKNHHDSGDADL